MLYVNGQKTQAKELVRTFGIQFPDPKEVKFESIQMGKDEHGQPRVPKSQRWIPEYTVKDSTGDSYTIRYTEREPVQTKEGLVYIENFFMWEGISKTVNLERDLDLAVWFFLNPKNKKSPYKNGAVAVFDVVDLNAIAEKEEQTINLKYSNIGALKAMDVSEIRTRTKGLKKSLFNVNVDKMKDRELVVSLMKLSESNPIEFKEQFFDDTTKFKGKVMDAVDKGLMEFIPTGTGGKGVWRWTTGEKTQIVNVNSGVKEDNLLQHFLDNPEQYSKIHEALFKIENKDRMAEAMRRAEGTSTNPDSETVGFVNTTVSHGIFVEHEGAVWYTIKGQEKREPKEQVCELDNGLKVDLVNHFSKNPDDLQKYTKKWSTIKMKLGI